MEPKSLTLSSSTSVRSGRKLSSTFRGLALTVSSAWFQYQRGKAQVFASYT